MREIAALIYPGFELLDLYGPMEMLWILEDDFRLHLVAERAGPVPGNQGLSAVATRQIRDNAQYDVLFVPGGEGSRREVENGALLDWIADTSARTEYTLSVCTGSALLARSGVLDERAATSNKAAFCWVMTQGQNVKWQRKARWVEDGRYFTSSGVSAGMDMVLAAIAAMTTTEKAEGVATACEYIWNRDKDDDPFTDQIPPCD